MGFNNDYSAYKYISRNILLIVYVAFWLLVNFVIAVIVVYFSGYILPMDARLKFSKPFVSKYKFEDLIEPIADNCSKIIGCDCIERYTLFGEYYIPYTLFDKNDTSNILFDRNTRYNTFSCAKACRVNFYSLFISNSVQECHLHDTYKYYHVISMIQNDNIQCIDYKAECDDFAQCYDYFIADLYGCVVY